MHLPHGAELLDKYPHQLSGGMCQRVLIAMAFASRPRLLVADEPTTALDVTIQARIVKLIAEMQKRDGTSVIFITHDLRLAAQICDEILVLYAGRPAERGPARQLFAAPAHPYTRSPAARQPEHERRRAEACSFFPNACPACKCLKELTGCRFASRCPVAVPECRITEPPFVQVGSRPHHGVHSPGDDFDHRSAPHGALCAAPASGAADPRGRERLEILPLQLEPVPQADGVPRG